MLSAKILPTQDDWDRIAGWVQPKIVLLNVQARDCTHALEIAATAAAQARRQDPAPWFRALQRREQAGSTALGCAVAIPHARVAGLAEPMTVFLRPSSALHFGAPAEEAVSQLLVILVPPSDARDEHLQLLAIVAQLFATPGVRKRLLAAPTVDAVTQVFREGLAEVHLGVSSEASA